MKKLMRQMTALLLVFCMCLSVFSLTVSAAEVEQDQTDEAAAVSVEEKTESEEQKEEQKEQKEESEEQKTESPAEEEMKPEELAAQSEDGSAVKQDGEEELREDVPAEEEKDKKKEDVAPEEAQAGQKTEKEAEGGAVENPDDDEEVEPQSMTSWHLYVTDNRVDTPVTCWSNSAHGSTYGTNHKQYIPLGTKMSVCYDNLVFTEDSTVQIEAIEPDGTKHWGTAKIKSAGKKNYGYLGFTPNETKATGLCTGILHVGNETKSVSWYIVDSPINIQSITPNQTITAEDSTSISVHATGSHLTYQWYYTTTGNTADGVKVVGATQNVLNLANVPYSFNGRSYFCEVSNYSSTSSYSKVTKKTSLSKLTVKKRSMVVSAENYSVKYDGNPHTIAVKVSGPSAYKVYYSLTQKLTSDNYLTAGTTIAPTRTDVGKLGMYFYIADETGNYYNYIIGLRTVTIKKADPYLAFAETSMVKYLGEPVFVNSLTAVTEGDMNYVSSDPAVATVDNYGNVSVMGLGSTYITVYTAESGNYNAGSASYYLEVKPQEQGVLEASDLQVKSSAKGKSVTLTPVTNSDAVLSYRSSYKKVKIKSDGTMKIPKNYMGKFDVTISAPATYRYTAVSQKITVTVVPQNVGIKKMVSKKKRIIEVEWKKISGVSGYQVEVTGQKGGTKGKQKKKMAQYGSNIHIIKVEGLSSRKVYTVRVRAYKQVKKKKIFGDWTKEKKIKVK